MVSDCKSKDTKATDCHYAYAQTVVSQVNPNATKRVKWEHPENAIGYHTDTVATSSCTRSVAVKSYKNEVSYDKNGKKITTKVPDKTEDVYNHPYVLASSDYHMEIPSGSYLYEIKFEVRMRMTGNKNATVSAPKLDFRVAGKSNHYVEIKKNLSSSFATYTYVMDRSALKSAGVTIDSLNRNQMGADIIFGDAKFSNKSKVGSTDSVDVQVEWIRCHIEYDTPQHNVSIYNPLDVALDTSVIVDGRTNTIVNGSGGSYTPYGTGVKHGTESNPLQVKNNKSFSLEVHYTNKSMAYGSNPRTVEVTIPQGTRIVSVGSESDGSFNTSTNVWSFNSSSNADLVLYLNLATTKVGLSNVSAKVTGYVSGKTVTRTSSYYYDCYGADDFDDISISAVGTIRRGTLSCVQLEVKGISNDESLVLNVSNTLEMSDGSWSLVTPNGVELISQSSSSATLKVPVLTDYHFTINYCFYPNSSAVDMIFTTSETSNTYTYESSVEPAYDYVLVPKSPKPLEDSSRMVICDHRVASDLEYNTDVTVIPCVADEGDATMVMSKCTLGMSVWEDLDYIGCVPLEHLHFDPKSTYKDKLLDSRYKNKRYMGKQLASDEEITLNVRLHPQQVTTMQGLIDMDKPIPINANHKCFEGDSLNHRGWAEIYGIKAEKTNEHWYKCEIDVKYLTHNLNTRFKISKGAKVDDYVLPDLMSEVVSSGDNLSSSEYFNTDTDGTFYYANDTVVDNEPIIIEDTDRNTFSIGNGQHIRVTSVNPLTHTSTVDYTWSSTILSEYRENDVSRVVRLINKSGVVLFEYEYDDIVITSDEVSANVIYRYLQSDGSYLDGNDDITFRYTPADTDATVVTDTDIEDDIETGEAHYGSTLQLKIVNNVLSLVDMGFNGKEVTIPNLPLVEDSYIYQVEWVNNNNDAESSDVDCTFDFVVQDTILNSTYADKFSKLIVSPFPVPDKKVLFTRNGDEGTIYYYHDDDEEFSYLVEPYYQYMNGTDLVTSDKVSIFNLNYGYEIVYIQNGLVRLGFNRLNGDLYLGKYDPSIDDYITTQRFHLAKFDDLNLNSISDDVIEVQASDSVFTIYRGHPYIKIRHNSEDILIDTAFSSVWAEKIGSNIISDVPVYHDLFNDENLLDDCVASDLRSSCIDVSEHFIDDRQESSLSWNSVPSDMIVGTEYTFKLEDTQLNEQSDIIYVEGGDCIFGNYTVEYECDNTPTMIPNIVADDIIQTGDESDVSVRVVDTCMNPVNNIRVDFYEILEPTITILSDMNIMQSGDVADITAKVKDEDGSLVQDVKVDFYKIVDYLFKYDGLSSTSSTDDGFGGADSRVTVSVGSTGTTLTANNSESPYIYWADIGGDNNYYDFNGDVTIDFDVVSLTGQGAILQIYSDGSEQYFNKNIGVTMGASANSKIHIEFVNGVVSVKVNDTLVDGCTTQTDIGDNNYRIGFRGYAGDVLTFKNFVIKEVMDDE